jgi:hypothetical protein
MALLDAKFVPLAKKLLYKYGMTASLKIRDEQASFNESTGTRESWSDETFTVKAVPPTIAKDLIRDGSNETDAVTYITPLDIEGNNICDNSQTLKNCDSFTTSDGKSFKVLNHSLIYSGDLVALIRLDLE